jgi:hypothetical protein
MADRFYQVALGGDMVNDVTEAGATNPAAVVEIRVTYDAIGMNRMQAIKGIEACVQYINQDTFPPV